MKRSVFLLVGLLVSLESSLYHEVQITAATADVDVINECKDYKLLRGAHRSVTNYNAYDERCDNNLTGWYRFIGEAGRMMPTTCVAKFHCGAFGPGWLDGDHPMPQDGIVTRRVCFHLEGECCKKKINITVRNCGYFMVYHLSPPPSCPLKYCGDQVHEAPHYCKNYSLLTGVDRAQGYYNPFVSLTDAGLTPGWYRFSGGAGTQMATKCVKLFHCGGHATGWINGPHPLKTEGAVMREICFHWDGDCCHFTSFVMVAHCSYEDYEGFFVYELPGTGISFLRYCGNGKALHYRNTHGLP